MLAVCVPSPQVTKASAKAVAGGLTQVTLQLQNTGYMRSSATSQVGSKLPALMQIFGWGT